jgi:small-conductance mechanosensitive channel
VSADYTLIQLYFPLVFFLNARRVSRWDFAYVALFAVLLIPVDYHYFMLAGDGVSTSVIVYPLAMVTLMVLAILDSQRVVRHLGVETGGQA